MAERMSTNYADRGNVSNRRLIGRLVLLVFAMFGFGFALVPLYDVFCDITGLNGKTGTVDARLVPADAVDRTRVITVEFTGNTAGGLPWDFRPSVAKMEVHPGALTRTTYVARNTSSRAVIGRAIPSVTPGEAAAHFKKTECFCFTEQTLEPGEVKEMSVQFVVESDLPPGINTITLSYAFFNAEKYARRTDRGVREASATPGDIRAGKNI